MLGCLQFLVIRTIEIELTTRKKKNTIKQRNQTYLVNNKCTKLYNKEQNCKQQFLFFNNNSKVNTIWKNIYY